jgi:drug/metabolite transporter (DMT)-like permease
MVPLFSAVIFRTRVKNAEKMGVTVALIGLILLTLKGVGGFNSGDFLTLAGAVCFAFHIITVGHFTNRTNSIQFAIMQIGGVGLFSFVTSLIFEVPSLRFPVMTWLNMLFLAVFCTSAAFITQSIAQRYTTSTHTALIYINEPVFAAFFGYFVAGEILGVRGIIGGLLMLSGILIAELGADIGKRLKNA